MEPWEPETLTVEVIEPKKSDDPPPSRPGTEFVGVPLVRKQPHHALLAGRFVTGYVCGTGLEEGRTLWSS